MIGDDKKKTSNQSLHHHTSMYHGTQVLCVNSF